MDEKVKELLRLYERLYEVTNHFMEYDSGLPQITQAIDAIAEFRQKNPQIHP